MRKGRKAIPKKEGSRKMFGSMKCALELAKSPSAKITFTAKSTFLTKVLPFNGVLFIAAQFEKKFLFFFAQILVTRF